MANIINTFTLKLQDQDFKSNLENLQKTQQQYQQQIAKGLVDSANKTQNLRKIEEKALKAKSKLLTEGLSKSDKRIKAIDKTIASTKLLVQAEKKSTTGLKEAEIALDKVYGQQIKSTKATEQQTLASKKLLTVNQHLAKAQFQQKKATPTSRGVWDTKDMRSYYTELEKSTKATDKNSKAKKINAESTSSLANQTIRYLRWAGTIVGVLYAVNRVWRVTLGTGIEVNKMMEDNTSGIGALLSANTQMVLSNGEMVDSYEKFKLGQQVATKTMDELRKASIRTYATFPQLTEIFQQAIGQTLSMGKAFGSTVKEINSNTIELSQRMSNIAGAIGMPMDRVREEIRSLLSANASTDSLIATMLFGSPTEANKAIRMAKDRGEGGLTRLLNSVLAPFDALENVDSYTRSLLQLEDAWSQLWQTASQPLFETLKDTFKDLAVDINDAKNALQEWRIEINSIADVSKKSGLAVIQDQIRQTAKTIAELEQDKGSMFGLFDKAKEIDIKRLKTALVELKKVYKELSEESVKAPSLATELTVDKKFLDETASLMQKNKTKTLQIEEQITKAQKQQEILQKRIAIRDGAHTKNAELRRLADVKNVADKKLIVALEGRIQQHVKEIAEIREKANDKESKALDRRFNEIRKNQNAQHKVFTDRDKSIDDQYKKVEDYQNQGFDNWKRIQKEKEQEAQKAFQAQQNFRRLQAELIRDEKARAIELAKINLDSRRAELLVLKEKEGWTDEYYTNVLAAEEELSRRIMQGYTEYGQLMATVGNSMESSFSDFFDFTSDGFMDMEDMALDVLDSIYKALLKNYIIGEATTATTGGSGIVGAITSFDYSSLFAKGDAFSNSPSLSAHSNTVVSQPTPFFFATGGVPNLGIMGEAGREAIMPLTRTSDGDLGVKAVSQAPKKITVNIVNESGQEVQATQAESSFDMEGTVISIVIDAVQTNRMGARDVLMGGNS